MDPEWPGEALTTNLDSDIGEIENKKKDAIGSDGENANTVAVGKYVLFSSMYN